VASIVLLIVRRYGIARITSSVAVATVLIGWAVAQYPYLLLPYLTIEEAARSRTTLIAMTVVLVLGSLVLVPALIYMFVLFSRSPHEAPADGHDDSTRANGAGVNTASTSGGAGTGRV
jgi:cytochrome d ubiquinol oxidase subunit II